MIFQQSVINFFNPKNGRQNALFNNPEVNKISDEPKANTDQIKSTKRKTLRVPLQKVHKYKPKHNIEVDENKSLIDQFSQHLQTLAVSKHYDIEIVDILNS